MSEIKLGKYRHYKGMICQVIGVGHHSESLEELVFYRDLGDNPKFGRNSLWARPVAMFFEEVEVDGKKVPRFTFLEE